MATITSYYAKAALVGAKQQGFSTHTLLAHADIPHELLSAPNARVHEDQLSQLIRLIWDTLEDEFMGFTAHKCKQGSFAMMCKLVSHCNNLEGLLKQAIEFYYLLTDDISMGYEQHLNDITFHVKMKNPELDPDHFYLEFWLVIWHRFASWITGSQIPLKKACFSYPSPQHIDEFPLLFPCQHYFNQDKNSFVFDQKYLQKPLIRTPKELANFLKNSPSDLMTIPGNDNSLNLQIRRLILQSNNTLLSFPTFDDIAKCLSLSPQTLRRKLHVEGGSYQQIKNSIRRDIAIDRLYVHNQPIHEIAELLGFAEARSFSRAFKQWTGLSPSYYRHHSNS